MSDLQFVVLGEDGLEETLILRSDGAIISEGGFFQTVDDLLSIVNKSLLVMTFKNGEIYSFRLKSAGDAKPLFQWVMERSGSNAKELSFWKHAQNGIIKETPLYPGLTNFEDPYKIPLGLDALNAKTIFWDIQRETHLLISGGTGTGKSVLLQNVIHYLRHFSEFYEVFTVDLLGSSGLDEISTGFITTVQEAYKLINDCYAEVVRRNEILESERLPRFDYILREKHSVRDMVIVFDEFAELSRYVSPEFNVQLKAILLLGAAVGVHVILSGQRLDMESERFLEEISKRVHLGPFSSKARVLLPSEDYEFYYTTPSNVRGRGFIWTQGKVEEIVLFRPWTVG